MEFEFDDVRSRRNAQQHGLDFIQAQVLWEDPGRVEIPARTEDEQRSIVIGKIKSQYWSAVVTYRNEKARIISVRRSRHEEIHIYEG